MTVTPPGAVLLRRRTELSIYYLAAMLALHIDRATGVIALAVGLLLFGSDLKRLLDLHLVGSWRRINEDAERLRASQSPRGERYTPRPLIVLSTAAVALTAIRYFGGGHTFSHLAGLLSIEPSKRYQRLAELAYWSLFRVFAYTGLPWLAVRLMRGERLRDYGLAARGFFKHLRVYGILYLIVLPPLVVASATKPFLRTYPFYQFASRSWTDLITWELLYVVQFFALELFFRGFMLHPLKASLGAYAIFAMALPYGMIHFRKPLGEALGAFVAAVVLGTLSLRTDSIWAGVLIHASVALTMDTLALAHKSGMPEKLWIGALRTGAPWGPSRPT